MAIIDADSKGMYLLIVLIVSSAVILGKFIFFNVQYYYVIKRMIFGVVRCLADQAYGGCNIIAPPADTKCVCKSDALPAVDDDVLAEQIEKDYDSYVINLSKYLDNNADSNRRLDILNAESAGYVDFYNWLEVMKLFVIMGFVVGAILLIVRLKYKIWLSPLNLITTKTSTAALP